MPVIVEMLKWLNPTPKIKNEFEFENQDGFFKQPPATFSASLKQISKRKPSKKSKRDRVADKSILLSKRLGSRKKERGVSELATES